MRIELPSGTPAAVAGDPGDRGLVVVPDIFGLRPLVDSIIERLANDWSCRVCAIELYPGHEEFDLQQRFDTAPAMDDSTILADMISAADIVGGERVGAIGFCMGGMYALKATSTGRFDRVAPFYGMIKVPESWHGPGQGEPLDHVGRGDSTSVMEIVGSLDAYTPPDDIAALRSTGATVVEYSEAEHGFVHDTSRPAHRPADAADAWGRAADWLWS